MSTLHEEGLDAENFYDYVIHDRNYLRGVNSTGTFNDASTSAIFRSVLTILLRIGFLLVQIASVPVGNVNLILLQNIVDFCAVTIVYILVGFVVAFTGDIAGVVGEGVWIGDSKANMNEAMIGWGAAVATSAICTCGIVGRMHTVGYLVTAILISAIVQPFLIHWAWTPQGWMAGYSLNGRPVSFRDFAGAGTVHVVGGLSGFLGCLTLGRRILRLRDIDDASLPADSPGSAFAGYFLIFVGLQGLSLPITDHGTWTGTPSHLVPRILINNLLAASSSSLFIVALHFALSREAFNYWTVMRCVQGAISGVVSVAAGVDVYSPAIAIGISCSSGLIFYLVSRRVYRSALEDYCNIVATHLACALFGSFLAPLCGRPRGPEAVNHAMVLDIAWQVICIIALLSLVVLVMGPFFVALEFCGFLRNRSEFVNHLRATTALERGPPRSYMQRLFFPDIESLYLQPGSAAKTDHGPQNISPRLWRYQQELARLEQTRSKQLGGNNLSEIPEDVNVQGINPGVRDTADRRIKKARQIHTLGNGDPSGIHLDDGGTGESLEKESSLRRSAERHLPLISDDILNGLGVDDEKYAVANTDKLGSVEQRCLAEIHHFGMERAFQSLAGSSNGGVCTMLHRTPNFTRLHSDEPNTKLDSSEDIRPSDLIVKVFLEPRRKVYASSDSEDERTVEGLVKIIDQ